MNPDHDRQDDEQMAALFAAADHQGPPPDRALLDKLREQSTEVFQSAGAAAHGPSTEKPQRGTSRYRKNGTPKRRSPMFLLTVRGLMAAAAAAVVVAALVFAPGEGDQRAAALEQALDKLGDAGTLHLELTAGEKKSEEAWVRQPGRMRINRPDGTYRIVRQGRQWLVDEKANRAASSPADYFAGESGRLDLLRLLGVPEREKAAASLGEATAERVTRDGRAADFYRAKVPHEKDVFYVVADVDPGTGSLRSLALTDFRGKRIYEIKVLGIDPAEPPDEDLFVVGDTLTEDGRIGKVTDAQGIVALRPVMARRWTPVAGPAILQPGDWLRTDARGANAVAVRLVPDTALTLGPGTLVELPTPKKIKLAAGEVKLVAGEKSPVDLLGPDGQQERVTGEAIYRLDKRTGKLTRVEKPPLWLAGFEGTTAHDSIGSLVANVEGRNVPLTVGYHKVTVDVRDQIARTVIEESFVNHTASRLEGVFYFPLPQDASISGFGMWIGDELVEADVVEKQRAREIYETILREKRDPGLLEWTGGNLFKARVFPIFAHSEKRIKITYTQVLPLENGRYRYSYALQSEMLKLHPLRELSIDVKLNSAVPLGEVTCPTHLARIDKTAHSAHVEFSAQEYTPDRDFEVAVGLSQEGGRPPVVLIPHRRGDDGYFMALVTPPDGDGGWQRETLPDGEPVELLVLADTSGSMDDAARQNQAEFLAALFGSLTPEDRVNLAVCDVDCHWAFDGPQPATAENLAAARNLLDARVSLGWTDLDAAFASALAQCNGKTRVIYVGDGVVNTVDADPVAFSKRLRRLAEGRAGSFHAVSVGSSFEPIVLKTIASLGGGSVRQISGERTPQKAAAELLAEMTRPAIRDLKVGFRGIRTARVYPEELPNLAAGTQQIVIGRYLPEGEDQHGQVIVTGTDGGRPVKFTADVSLADAEHGNSFIPRLWARMHLNALLEQGASPAVKDEIIALSEEYHIITPYTSLLVLESDEDRERFKVKRRFQMRDGEKFFAEGRDRADYELVQKQMRLAGNWRLGLRRRVLGQLMGLGRDAGAFQARHAGVQYGADMGGGGMGGGGRWDMNGLDPYAYGYLPQVQFSNGRSSWAYAGSGTTGFEMNMPLNLGPQSLEMMVTPRIDIRDEKEGLLRLEPDSLDMRPGDEWDLFADGDGASHAFGDRLVRTPATGGEWDLRLSPMGAVDSRDFEPGAPMSGPGPGLLPPFSSKTQNFEVIQSQTESLFSPMASTETRLGTRVYPVAHLGLPVHIVPGTPDGYFDGLSYLMPTTAAGTMFRRSIPPEPDTSWLTGVFPSLPGPPAEPPPLTERWPDDARRLAEQLMRTDQLAALAGGLRIERTSESFDVRWDRLTGRSEALALVSPEKWLTHTGGDGSPRLVQFCNPQQRGVFSLDLGLGRVRKSTPQDLATPPAGLTGHLTTSLERTCHAWEVKLRPQGDGRTLIVLRQAQSPDDEQHLLVDTPRAVVLWIEHRHQGKVTSTKRFDDFKKIAGAWWATRFETFDAEGRRAAQATIELTELDDKALAAAFDKELAAREEVQFLHDPPPAVEDAKQAKADGRTSFDDRFALMVHVAARQDWDRVFEELEAAEALAEGKPGMKWVRGAVLLQARRREELRERALDEAKNLAKSQADELYLANLLISRAGEFFEANEMLELLDVLKPVFERQPVYLQAVRSWTQRRMNYLRNAGRADEVLPLKRELAERHPHDASLQERYARALFDAGERPAAYAWLDRVITPETRWLPHEEQSLRGAYADLLAREGRYGDLAEYLAAWVAKDPAGQTAYDRYLSALVHTDREEEMTRLVDRWLDEGRRPGPLEPAVLVRLHAAVSLALGRGYDLGNYRPDQRWSEPLAGIAERFAADAAHADVADWIMGNGQFQQTDACRRVRRNVARRLVDEIGTLPSERIRALVGWIWPNDPAVEERQWRRIARGIEKRWEDAQLDAAVRNQLAGPLVQILSGRLTAEEHLAFLRRQLAEGPEPYRLQYVNQLFNALLASPWSEEHEDEAFSLLGQLSPSGAGILPARQAGSLPHEEAEQLWVEVEALHRMTDAFVQARYKALMAQVEHPEELTRTELRDKQQENLRTAREGYAARLQRAMAGECSEALRPWVNVERLYLEVLLKRDLDKVAEECWEMLGPKPKRLPADDEPIDLAEALDLALRSRLLTMLANLAARREAKPEAARRLLSYFDRGIEQAGESRAAALVWRLRKYQLLVALDRPKDLERSLRAWIDPAEATNFWRRSLAYLLAEQGKLKEAVALFEQIEAADELSPADYRALAGWYMAVDEREKHERALIEAFKATDEWRLSQWLSAKLRPWQRSEGELPGELDKDVLRVFAALFEKSSNPQNYHWQLREFYRASRDFRLLTCIADAVVGHTAGRVYPFLESMQSVLDEVRDEGTADSIVEHLAEVRRRAKTPVDHRALDLLELLVERRSSEVLNQPGPHAQRALAAMQRAFKREWSDGEPRLMADLLAGLGRITQQALADEQVRELTVLHAREEKGTTDRLHVAHALARTYWAYDGHEEAVKLLEAALAEREAACDGVLPTSANGPLDTLITYLESRTHHARGERMLFDELKHPANGQQALWLTRRLYQLYDSAIGRNGDVSLGRGPALYAAVEKKLQEELTTDDNDHLQQLVNRLTSVYRTAHDKKFSGVVDDLRRFAFEQIGDVLARQTNDYQYQSMASTVAQTLRDLAGARDGLRFLVERIEQEPSWFRLDNRDGWSQHAYQLAQWRNEVGDELGDIEPRLLAIVLRELKLDLQSRQSRNRNMYHRHHGNYFWEQKAEDFFRTAEEVYAEQKGSGAAVHYIADYLYWGLDRHARAIEILQVAHRAKLLDEGGQSTLVDFLRRQNRFRETIPVLEPLVELRPENMQYRTWLMNAYFHAGRRADLLALLKTTDEYFHEEGRWQEAAMAALAHSCLENELFEQSVAYFEEVISLHQRTQPGRGIGNGTLSGYYESLAHAYSELGKTPEAVDAACGAIVSWGRRHDRRADALLSLERVLREAPDLKEYVAHLDREAAESGMQNPIVRKALGKLYFERDEFAEAIEQLKVAVEVQPNDTKTHQMLVACYDELGDKDAALRRLLDSARLSRRDVELYKDLADRYEKLGRPQEAERARTSIVEALPNESEGHAALAEIRQKQDRWDDAIVHWRQVAEIRALEPTGLLNLAGAQIHRQLWDAAAETVARLRARSWPARFDDVDAKAREFERRIGEGRSGTR